MDALTAEQPERMWLLQQLGKVALVGNPRFTPMPGIPACKRDDDGNSAPRCDIGAPPGFQVALLGAAYACWTVKLPYTAAAFLAVSLRVGMMCTALQSLPSIKSPPHFENCRFRVLQCVSLIAICAAIYSTLPTAVQKKSGHEGYKHNLVTMESSMASCIASTYGYSVAGGIPGGLLGEYVMSWVGKKMVAELLRFVGVTANDDEWLPALVRACVSFTLFTIMGSYMEWVVVLGYAFAQQETPENIATKALELELLQQHNVVGSTAAAESAAGSEKFLASGQRDPATDQAAANPRDPMCVVSLPSAVDAIDSRRARLVSLRRQSRAVSRSPSPAVASRKRR